MTSTSARRSGFVPLNFPRFGRRVRVRGTLGSYRPRRVNSKIFRGGTEEGPRQWGTLSNSGASLDWLTEWYKFRVSNLIIKKSSEVLTVWV